MGLRTEQSVVLSVSENKTPTDLRTAGVNQCPLTEAFASISAFVFLLSWMCFSVVLLFYVYVYVLLSVLTL